jgi:hypothetical protein
MWRVGDVVGDVESSVLNKEQLNNHGLLACLHLQQLTSHAPFILFQSPSKPGMFTAASRLACCCCSTRFQRSDVARTSFCGTACLGLISRRR